MKCLLAAALILIVSVASSQQWQQRTNYNIKATLNDTLHTIDGELLLNYINNSPDTLKEVWFHLWPNAFKEDNTAYTSQSLLNNDTRFYFSKPSEKGYINRINFVVNGKAASLQDHPEFIDAVKLVLPQPLPPGSSVDISTPFHVQLPYLFSRIGHIDQFYSVTQWFPKAAVYDEKGWHVMPYLETGEYYANFGNYTVEITLPENYIVGATGTLIKGSNQYHPASAVKKKSNTKPKQLFTTARNEVKKENIPSSSVFKTLVYKADSVVDFAWFADKSFIVKSDTTLINSKVVELHHYMHAQDTANWRNSMMFAKRGLQFYSNELGPYPYPHASVVAFPGNHAQGMEYPMITLLNMYPANETFLDLVIVHEQGHNWLQGILATNERDYPWMDEGMNTYYEKKYLKANYKPGSGLTYSALMDLYLLKFIGQKTDVPINTSSGMMKPDVYGAIAYEKASQFFQLMEKELGTDVMKKIMRTYYESYKFRHPSPLNFKQVAEQVAGRNLDPLFVKLDSTGQLNAVEKREIKLVAGTRFTGQRENIYVGVAPVAGFNNYDGLQVGLGIHNYNTLPAKFQFAFTPMFAFKSKQLTGYGHLEYALPTKRFQFLKAGIGLAHFGTNSFTGKNSETIVTNFTKLSPSLKFQLRPNSALSTISKTLTAKVFFISEQQVELTSDPPPNDTVFYAVPNGSINTIIPQLTYTIENSRTLYPWKAEFRIESIRELVRSSFTGNYNINYKRDKKFASFRLFAGKIFYTTNATDKLRNQLSRYHFTMYAPNGEQDYTYSSPFADRNQNTGLAGRQIHMRDGGFKYRSDYSSVVPGLKSNGVDYFDNWIVTLNTSLDIPDKFNPLAFLPVDVPLKIFADAGTSASPWRKGSKDPRFLYSIGLQLPISKVINFYYPLIQSKAFKEPNNVNDPNREGGPTWWQKRLTFSIDVNELKKLALKLPFN